jgi:glycosyltransferase involved in cell wall biosynthesis
MSIPRLSVLMPVRNARETLDEALESIRAQTFADYEVIAVDDGSTDGSGEALDRWSQRDPRIRVVCSQTPGLANALNTGLAVCQAELVARMDADDVCFPTRFARSLEFVEQHPEISVVGTQVEIFRTDRPVSPNLQTYAAWMNALLLPEELARERFIESPLCHPSVLFRRTAITQAGGYRAGDHPEDYELWLRLHDLGHTLAKVPAVLLRWRDHDRRATRQDSRYRRDAHLSLKAHHLAHALHATSVIIWGTGPLGLRLFRALRARGVRVEGLVDIAPRKIGQKIDGVRVWGPEQLPSPQFGLHLIAAVGAHGGRSDIRVHAGRCGYQEGVNLTCAA